jgi:hypothetical protein
MAELEYGARVAEVEVLCVKHLGCSWADLCGDTQPLEDYYATGHAPFEFASSWSGKYDLTWFESQTSTRVDDCSVGGWVTVLADCERRDSGSLKNGAEGGDTAWGWGPPRAGRETISLERRFSASSSRRTAR